MATYYINDKKWLENQYNVFNRSLQSIADELDVCRETLRKKFLEFDIKRRATTDHLKGKEKPKSQKRKMSLVRKKFWDEKDEDYINQHKLKVSKTKTIHGIRPDGRKRVYILNRGALLEYRVLVEQAIGRELKPTEIIHHEDEDCTNNDLSNLKILTPSLHGKLHYKSRIINQKGQLV